MAIKITFENGRKKITLPPSFVLKSDDLQLGKDVILVANAINKSALRYNQPLLIDMSHVTSLNASAAVLLFAYITSAQIVSGDDDFVVVALPDDEKMRFLVRRSGLWDAIRRGGKRKLEKNWSTDNNFQSGFTPELHLELTLDLITRKWGTIPYRLNTAINEAILNIKQHAYSINGAHATPRWWQYLMIKDDALTFVIYDKGIGIPSSFRKASLFRGYTDPQLIEKAMTRQISSTGISGRGNGSMNIKKPVAKEIDDKLMICSQKGAYTFLKEGQSTLSALPVELPGTLVCWRIGIHDD
ncbi:MAG: hypothetical protein ABJH06_11990 [Paraglaciecola sp.]|uniref:hypothetical protein n=1 Tax=Paraglaciecola sp. TaxID=1920173 RepID=UPI003296B252